MATFEEQTAMRDQLKAKLSELEAITPRALIRHEDLGKDMNFGGGEAYFARTLQLFHELLEVPLDSLPYAKLNELNTAATNAKASFDEILTFSLNQNYPQGPGQRRDQLINTVRDQYDAYWNVISPVLAYATRRGIDFSKLERDARAVVKEIEEARTAAAARLDSVRLEADQILESMRAAAAESGVSQQAVYFKQEADEQKDAAGKWLIATSVLAIITILFALWSAGLFAGQLAHLTTGEAIQVAVAKLIAFSVLYYALVIFARSYMAARHNFVVNRHRQNALSTFQAFVKATAEEQTKDAVLIKATEAVFSPDVSGYLAKEPDPRGVSQILEIFRTKGEAG